MARSTQNFVLIPFVMGIDTDGYFRDGREVVIRGLLHGAEAYQQRFSGRGLPALSMLPRTLSALRV